MASAVSICSNALLMLGANTINSLSENTARAKQCANLYPIVRDYVIAQHPWKCCTKRVSLNPDSDTPAYGWAMQYTLPADYVRMRSVGEDGAEPEYQLENGKILCDESPMLLRYVFRNEVAESYSPTLVMALTLAMRQVLAYPVTQSTSLEQLIDQAIAPTLKQARAIDSQDEPPETLGDFRLLGARFSPRTYMGS